MKTFDMAQYSPSWYDIRRGVPTASNADRILTPTGKPSGQAEGYICELIAERVELNPTAFTDRGRMGTPEMKAGRDAEPEARRWYEMEVDAPVAQVGFCLSDDGRIGCSPDGLVGEDGLLELKAPMLKTQAAWLMAGGLPADYKPQVHFQLIVTGRQWVDFCSYAPGLAPLRVRVTPDEYTEKLRLAVEAFCARYAEACAKLLRTPEDKTGEALEQWSIRLDGCQTPDQLTASLPLLADLREWPEARRKAWAMIREFAGSKGWAWNESHKTFLVPQPVAAGELAEPDW